MHSREIRERQRLVFLTVCLYNAKYARGLSGSEFIAIATQTYFDQKGIYHVTKRGQNMASFAGEFLVLIQNMQLHYFPTI